MVHKPIHPSLYPQRQALPLVLPMPLHITKHLLHPLLLKGVESLPGYALLVLLQGVSEVSGSAIVLNVLEAVPSHSCHQLFMLLLNAVIFKGLIVLEQLLDSRIPPDALTKVKEVTPGLSCFSEHTAIQATEATRPRIVSG